MGARARGRAARPVRGQCAQRPARAPLRAADLSLVAILPPRAGRAGAGALAAPLLRRLPALHEWVGARCECEAVFGADEVASLLRGAPDGGAPEREMAALRTADVVVAAFLGAGGDSLVGYARASGDRSFVCSIDRIVLRADRFAFAADVAPALLRRLAQQAQREYGIVDVAYRAGPGAGDDGARSLAAAGFAADRLGSTLMRYRPRGRSR